MADGTPVMVRTVAITLVAFGAHLCECAGFAYLPPMLLKAGFTQQAVSVLLGCGPLLCLFLVPLLGAWSDACARRRPFLLVLGVLIMTSLTALAFSDTFEPGLKKKVLIATATVVLDFASQAILNPCQALVSDISGGLGFPLYSGMLSLGGVLGYLFSAVHWTVSQERCVFLVLLLVFSICLTIGVANVSDARSFLDTESQKETVIPWPHHVLPLAGAMRRLFTFHLLAWMAVMSHYFYFTDFTAEVVYGATADSTVSFDEGVRTGSWGLLLTCVTASLYSLLAQQGIDLRSGPRIGLMLGMGSFAVAMAGLTVGRGITTALLLSGLAGIASAVLECIPYSLASQYCASREEYFQDISRKHGIGECLAVLDGAEYLAQVLLSLFMGYMFHLTATVASYAIVAFSCALAACYAATFVVYPIRLHSSSAYIDRTSMKQ
ncbi:solute carrier family 45 member 3-like isoform X2 [Ornithodoros turicata]|uniref:solute carrier family 45 member 3-like isoform X2 n=1 Tax=Ornithodoros turicata TaxID=34597 RepID=UPI00313975BC